MTSADKINTDAQKRRPVIIGVGQSVQEFIGTQGMVRTIDDINVFEP